MAQDIKTLESQWQDALAQENSSAVEAIVRTVLQNHPQSSLASEIRYKRGVLALTEGEGDGTQRLAKALAEFREGLKSAISVGASAEPWRSLNHTQIATSLVRRGNFSGAIKELREVIEYRPYTSVGLGAISILIKVYEDADRAIEARRYNTQRLSYARALVRENTDSPEIHFFRFLLAKELLDSPYKDEGQEILRELKQLSEDSLDPELFEDIQQA